MVWTKRQDILICLEFISDPNKVSRPDWGQAQNKQTLDRAGPGGLGSFLTMKTKQTKRIAMASSASASASLEEEKIVETLTTSRGWRFHHLHDIRSLILSHHPPSTSTSTVDSIEAQLMGMDLRDFGGKSLPDPSSLKKISHLQGPLVLQVLTDFHWFLFIIQINSVSEVVAIV